PDLTFILDLPVEDGLRRAGGRGTGGTRYERMDRGFHERLREGFLEIAKREPDRCVVIDVTAPIGEVQGAVKAAVEDRLGITLA
ncbi:MAG: thymidylate kinase, partial [Kiloniellales bacterium]